MEPPNQSESPHIPPVSDSILPELPDKTSSGYKPTSEDIKNVQTLQNMELRQQYAAKAFDVVRVWLGVIATILFLQGLSDEFFLSDTVILALIGSTTAGVLGLPAIVLHNLFPSGKNRNKLTK